MGIYLKVLEKVPSAPRQVRCRAAVDFRFRLGSCQLRLGLREPLAASPPAPIVVIEPWSSCKKSLLTSSSRLVMPLSQMSFKRHTQLFILNLCIKKKKKNNFCKIVMFMLYEIFIWNCFAKLLYFCMNVFFIGIIRNSYLTWLSLPHLFCLVYALAFSPLKINGSTARPLSSGWCGPN